MINREVKSAKFIRYCGFILNNPYNNLVDFIELFFNEICFYNFEVSHVKYYSIDLSHGIK